MATDDRQVLVAGQADAPAEFRVPGNGQIRPKTVYASYDGTNALGSYTPALKVTSDAGELVGIFSADSTLAAGESAVVTWFPHVGAAATATAAASLALAVGETVFANTTTIAAHTTGGIGWDDVEITDTGALTWSSGNPGVIRVVRDGVYMVWFSISPDVDWPAAAPSYVRWGVNITDTSGSAGLLTPFAVHPAIDWLAPPTSLGDNIASVKLASIFNPATIITYVENNSAAPFVVAGNSSIFVVRLGDVVTLP